jgi:predicted lipid carrier protein YhbT
VFCSLLFPMPKPIFVKAPFQKRILSYLEIKWYSLHSKLYVVWLFQLKEWPLVLIKKLFCSQLFPVPKPIFAKAPLQNRKLSYLEIKWYSIHSKLYIVWLFQLRVWPLVLFKNCSALCYSWYANLFFAKAPLHNILKLNGTSCIPNYMSFHFFNSQFDRSSYSKIM